MRDDHSLPLTKAEQVERLCDLFEHAWQSDRPLSIKALVADQREPERSALFQELLALELEYRLRKSEVPAPEHYVRQFPEYQSLIASIFGKFDAQARSGEHASADSTPWKRIDEGTTLQFPGDDAIAPGTLLGRFEIIELLGQGAFGSVFRARDRELDRDVALKVPRKGTLDESAVQRFLEEARAAAALKHPGIVTIHDVCRQDQVGCFVVMEYVPGRSLGDLVKAQPFGQEKAAELVAAIAEAVHVAHRQGLIHRDLKPSNVLVDSDGAPHVCDFGLALPEAVQRARPAHYAGTPAYMAPEQVRGETQRLDGRTDIWALGVILYEILTGRRPFQGGTPKQLADEILHRHPKPPRQIDEAISEDLQRICLKCLAKEVINRYASAHDLARDLRRSLRTKHRFRPFLTVVGLAVCALLVVSWCTRRIDHDARPNSSGQTTEHRTVEKISTATANTDQMTESSREDVPAANGNARPSSTVGSAGLVPLDEDDK